MQYLLEQIKQFQLEAQKNNMEQNTMPENSQAQENKTAIEFFGIETGILLVLAIIILGLLNYFNVFSLSKMYPSIFGFLPHQQFKENIKDSTEVSVRKLISPTYAPVDSKIKSEIDKVSKEIVVTQSSKPLKTLYLPSDVKNNTNNNKYYSSVMSYTSGLSVATLLGYNSNGQPIDRQIVVSHIPKLQQGIINNVLSLSIAKEYLLITTGGEFRCGVPGYSTTKMQCESVWTDGELQKSIDIVQIGDEEIGLSYCSVEKNSPLLISKACAPGIK